MHKLTDRSDAVSAARSGTGGWRIGGLGTAAAGLVVLLGVPAGDVLAQSAGQAVAVSGSVSASGPEGVRALAAGGPVYMGDTIDTGVFGEVQIEFTDATRLAIGPGSQVALDSYLVETRTTVSSFVINAARGALRFISGGSRSNSYQVNTPTATIGIRGTAFDISDRTGQRTNALLYDGRITACNVAGQCADLDRSCEIAVILADPAQPVQRSDTSQLVATTIRFQFPYLVDEARLLPQLQVEAARCLGNGGNPTLPPRGGVGGDAQPGTVGRGDQGGDGETGGGDQGGDGETGGGDIGGGDIGGGDIGGGDIGGGDIGGGDIGSEGLQ